MSKQSAQKYNKMGLESYKSWEIEEAIASFKKAVAADGDNPDYHLNLARALARNGRYDKAMEALGGYLHLETDTAVSARYERLFSSAPDEVETILIKTMKALGISMQQIGKAIQMWLEYRITIGRRALRIPKPELWAAGLTYAIAKVNFDERTATKVADAYSVSQRAVKEKYKELVNTLDLMPADYRYFTGDKNPLDKLVEAAQLLETLHEKFREA